jgi:redox-regulated HSP33 family molecular chaperone
MESAMIEKTPRTGFIVALTERLCTHPRIVTALHQAVQMTLRVEGRGVIEELVREMAMGEQLRVYVPKIDKDIRQARQQRIEAAIRTNEPNLSIAKREKVTERYVRKIRGRLKVPG